MSDTFFGIVILSVVGVVILGGGVLVAKLIGWG